MSNMSDSNDGRNISRRELAARAAERRIMQNARAIAAASVTGGVASSDNVLTTTASGAASASKSAGSGKRRAPSTSARQRMDSSSQVQFSDDDSDERVTCMGVMPTSSLGKGESDVDGRVKKRGRKDEAAIASGKAAPQARTLVAESKGSGAGTATSAAAGQSRSGPCVPKTFRLVSWNIDCLNPANRFARIEEVCAILLEADENLLPDMILLQEVDNSFLSMLNVRLGAGGRYRFYPQQVPSESTYFTIVFVRVSTVTVHDSSRIEFPNSLMGRDLTSVRCTFNRTPLLVMTSHLESEKDSSEERKDQFSQAMRALLEFDEGPAIFAGDTNLREAEVKQEKLVRQSGDMWQVCGADSEHRFTWDLLKNDNLVLGFQPRARYDRAFLNPKAKEGARSFALLGTERMAPPHSCFPSDHFGIDCSFEW